ncbi:SseB family protein [Faecalicatena orotica]|uniref:SseB family protein n=1 Tax=Faecalicatena orotica TaxID=1544 RepID=UPI003216F30E
MKVIKKICGGILILAGGAAALAGLLSVITEAVEIASVGLSWVEFIVMLIFLLFTTAGGGMVFAGIQLIRGRRLVKFRYKKVKKEKETKTEKETVNTVEVRQEPPARRYTLLVEDIFSVHGEGCIITGIVKGDTMSVGDKVWILGADGSQKAVRTGKLKVFLGEEVKRAFSAESGTRIGFWTKDASEEDVLPGSVISSVAPNVTAGNGPVENPRLKGLLTGRFDTDVLDIAELIHRELAGNAIFLVMAEFELTDAERARGMVQENSVMEFPYLNTPDGEGYQPVFTDWNELKAWERDEGNVPSAVLMGAEEVLSLIKKNHVLHGLVVNPFTDNLIMDRDELEML